MNSYYDKSNVNWLDRGSERYHDGNGDHDDGGDDDYDVNDDKGNVNRLDRGAER